MNCLVSASLCLTLVKKIKGVCNHVVQSQVPAALCDQLCSYVYMFSVLVKFFLHKFSLFLQFFDWLYLYPTPPVHFPTLLITLTASTQEGKCAVIMSTVGGPVYNLPRDGLRSTSEG